MLAVGSLVSSVFSEPSLNTWKLSIHVMLRLNMHGFEHSLTCLWDECNWTFFSSWEMGWGLTFVIQWPLLNFPDLLTYWVQHFDSIPSVKILNSSAGIPLPSLALLTAVLHKTHSTSHFRMSGSGWVATPWWLSGSLRSFLYSSLYSFHLSWISSVSIRSLPCLSFIVPIFGWNVLLMFPIFLTRSSRNTIGCLLSHSVMLTLWTVAHQAPLFMGFSRQEYWNGLPCPFPGDLPDPEIELMSFTYPALAGGFFNTRATWEAQNAYCLLYI